MQGCGSYPSAMCSKCENTVVEVCVSVCVCVCVSTLLLVSY